MGEVGDGGGGGRLWVRKWETVGVGDGWGRWEIFFEKGQSFRRRWGDPEEVGGSWRRWETVRIGGRRCEEVGGRWEDVGGG